MQNPLKELFIYLFIAVVGAFMVGIASQAQFDIIETKPEAADTSEYWEELGGCTTRRSVPGGWIYFADGCMTFVPVPASNN